MVDPEKIYPLRAGRNPSGHLTIAGHSLVDLAREYDTPLYIYDAETVRCQVNDLFNLLEAAYPGESEITYAAKAYFSLGMARRLAALSLGVDVVSMGELSIAHQAGFIPHRVHLHGNNKGQSELDAAIAWGIQAIVVDSLEELAFVESRAKEVKRKPRVWLRITPGLSVDTHPYRQTGHAASKFGLLLQDGTALEGIRRATASPYLRLTGLHTHLGSQVFETAPYRQALSMLLELAASCGFAPEELSPGGGWGVPYVPEDEDNEPQPWIDAICQTVKDECHRNRIPLPKLVIEPGRWIVARAGVAIYSIGTHKRTADGFQVISVDGGMADNLRPALYQARYTACIAERPDAPGKEEVRVVGKFCESGDELIPRVLLAETKRGDHLVMPVAGAYHLSMASNYNLAARPAVLWLEEGKIEVLQRREEAHESAWWIQEG